MVQPDCKSGAWRHGRFDPCHTHTATWEDTVNKPLCVVCNIRVARLYHNKACKKCSALTAAEGTRERYGLPKPRISKAKREAAFVQKYNQLIAEGFTVRQIAATMKMPLQSLKNLKGMLAKEGHKISASPWKSVPLTKSTEPVDRTKMRSGTNEHGGGKMGIMGCFCKPCRTARQANRRRWEKENAEKIKKYRYKYLHNREMPS